MLRSAGEVPAAEWLPLTTNPYESREWFLAQEEFFQDTRFLYFCAMDEGRLVALLPVYDRHSRFYIDSPQLISRRQAEPLRKLRFLISGSPASFASDVIGDPDAATVLAEALATHARHAGIDVVAFPFCRRPPCLPGMIRRPSLIDFWQDLPEPGIEGYLRRFRSKHRYLLRREMKLGMPCQDLPLCGRESLASQFQQLSASRHGAASFPPEFYAALGRHFGESFRLLVAGNDKAPHGVLSYFIYGGRLWMLHIGCRERDGTYFRLAFHEPIRLAERLGMKTIHCRPGSAEAKELRGCRGEPLALACLPISWRARVFLRLEDWRWRWRQWRRRRKHDQSLPIDGPEIHT
jgi:hypothetical protein